MTASLAVLSFMPALAFGAEKLTVVVVVVDSLMPSELGQTVPATPVLTGFRDDGTSYAESRSVFSAETVPNHVSMMTGMYPQHSGIPTNTYWDRTGTPTARDLSLPSELEATTLFTRINESCPDTADRAKPRTAAALSKRYLYEVFSECGFSGTDCGINDPPDQSFDPTADPTYIQPSGHTPDTTTMREARAYLPDADFLFVNLGDVDRSGHVDASGTSGTPTARYSALANTDTLVGQLIQDLKDAGRWDSTVMIILSDHGMDWSTPDNVVNLTPMIDPGLFAIQAGGTGSIYVADAADPLTALKNARATALAHEGVAGAWYREPNSLDLDPAALLPASLMARHENFGDLIVMAAPGWRISEPSSTSNPLPGNHGHKTTMHNTFIVGGGAPFVRAQTIGDPLGDVDHFELLPEQSEVVDVAATVAWLLGMDSNDMDGRPLREAFTTSGSPTECGVFVCPPAPSEDCRQPTRERSSRLSIRGGDKKRLSFAWTHGQATTAEEFGDPVSSDPVVNDALALCLYVESGSSARELAALRVPAGEVCGADPCWRRFPNGALKYADPELTPDGVLSVSLSPGDDAHTKITLKAQGDSIPAPTLPLDLPLRVQMHSESGNCWEARFEQGGVQKNDGAQFKARSAAAN